MLEDIIALIDQPEQQNSKLFVFANEMHGDGIRSNNLPTMGTAIKQSCRTIMDNLWTPEMGEAVDWFWKICSNAMAKTLDTIDR